MTQGSQIMLLKAFACFDNDVVAKAEITFVTVEKKTEISAAFFRFRADSKHIDLTVPMTAVTASSISLR